MSWEKKFFQGRTVFLFLNLLRACGKSCGKIPPVCFVLGSARKNSIGRLFVLAGYGKIPEATFLHGELLEKFRMLTFWLGGFWKNSAGRLSS